MALVKMLSNVSGTRNGEDWPPVGDTLELPDVEAAGLVRNGIAEIVDGAGDHAPIESATVDAAPAKRRG